MMTCLDEGLHLLFGQGFDAAFLALHLNHPSADRLHFGNAVQKRLVAAAGQAEKLVEIPVGNRVHPCVKIVEPMYRRQHLINRRIGPRRWILLRRQEARLRTA